MAATGSFATERNGCVETPSWRRFAVEGERELGAGRVNALRMNADAVGEGELALSELAATLSRRKSSAASTCASTRSVANMSPAREPASGGRKRELERVVDEWRREAGETRAGQDLRFDSLALAEVGAWRALRGGGVYAS
jgi:hypothetical protein